MYDVIKHKWIFFNTSIVLLLIGIISIVFVGFNQDIDFTGGTTMYVKIGADFNNDDVIALATEAIGVAPSTVQKAGTDNTEVVIKTHSLDSDQRAKLFSAVQAKYNLPQEALLSADNVTASVSNELVTNSFWQVVMATLLILVYITFRFEFKSGLAAVIALLHDTIFVLGFYSIFRLPINSTFIAAILTITGYSIMDTIVIYDRIRENSRIMKKVAFSEIVNKSIWQSATRSIYTPISALITIVALYIVGVPAVKEFALPIGIGIIVGTYSSNFIASPLWDVFKGEKKAKTVA